MSLRKIVVALLLAFVGLMFVVNITPEIEGNVSSANITSSFVSSMVDMAKWLIPIGGIIGLFYGIFRLFEGGRGYAQVGVACLPIMRVYVLFSWLVIVPVRAISKIAVWTARRLRKVP